MHKIIRKSLTHLLTFVFLLILLTIAPIVASLVILPIAVYRWLVSLIASLYKPNLGKLIDPISSILAAENFDTEDAFTMMCALEIQTASLDIVEIRKLVKENATERSDFDGRLLYPQLTQRVNSFLGYAFWENTKCFKLDQHVNYVYDLEEFHHMKAEVWSTEKSVGDLLGTLNRRRWNKERPLWEIILVPNVHLPYSDAHCLIVFRMHHSMGDGLCILQVLPTMMGYKGQIMDNIPISIDKAPSKAILEKLKLIIKTPLEVAAFAAKTTMAESSFTTKELSNMISTSVGVNYIKADDQKLHNGYSQRIPLSRIKDVKDAYGVSFTAVILAMIVSGCRDLILKVNKTKLPSHISVGFTIIMPGHRERMTNNMCFFMLPLPLGEADDLKRLKKISRILDGLKDSSVPWFAYFLSKFVIGQLPTKWIKWARINSHFSPFTTFSNLLGPNESLDVCGYQLLGLRTGINPPIDAKGWTFQFITFNGHGRLMVTGLDEFWASEEHAYEMIDYCNDALQRLVNHMHISV